MDNESWVKQLLSITCKDNVDNFNITMSSSQLNDDLGFTSADEIAEHYDEMMSHFFGSEEQAKSTLGTNNYDVIKYQMEEVAFGTMWETATSLSEDQWDELKFTKDQDVNVFHSIVKMHTKERMTDKEHDVFYHIIGMNLPMYEVGSNMLSAHSLGGFMSPSQNLIMVDTTGCDGNTNQIFHEVLHSVVREIRRTLDNEMYGATEADQREEMIVHYVTDCYSTVALLHETFSNWQIVKNKNQCVVGMKLNGASSFSYKVHECSCNNRQTNELRSFARVKGNKHYTKLRAINKTTAFRTFTASSKERKRAITWCNSRNK